MISKVSPTQSTKMEKDTIVLFPAPGIGHIVAMVELAKLIQTHRFTITIILTTGLLDHPTIEYYIRRITAAHPSISFLRLPHIPLSAATSVSLAARAFAFIKANASSVATSLSQISQTTAVKAFIIDLFCTSAMEPASSMGIPVYYFFTSGAAVLALFSYFPKLHEQGSESFKDMVGVELRVPGNAPLKAVNMPEPVLDRTDPSYWDMLYFCTCLPKARGIIVNSFPELEPLAVNAVAEGACFPNAERGPRVYYIGPLIAEPQQSGRDSKECLRWLEEQPRRSVVYLCFGSRGSFSVAQLKEIAKGLERSGHRFLWVVKKPLEEEGANQIDEAAKPGDPLDLASVLPNGFLERTKDRGMVVEAWAPQVEVLSRESVGGFVSHCGWNSVLEAVVAGVPMVAWPLYAEQHANREVMVGEMKVAVGVNEREEDGFVSAEEVEKRVREVMETKDIRDRSFKLKQMAMAAVAEFGSSTTALSNLVHSWTSFS
ncbi:UDP-glycosyltransferase 88F5-like isoform X2 [Vigna unguiculata]|uniref:UDP-glycosyltransferase 88F5-like isoform X2 n=1 Tax=Vigna unguiculata TaxID=3917 RepID=UPI001016B295|nr:UDP-glycosyltransferase 88F5-like isoform X2 [Vigna unguiculata]